MPKRTCAGRCRAIALALMLAGAPAAGQPAAVPPALDQLHADCVRLQYASDTLVCADADLVAIDAAVAALAAAPPALASNAIWEDQGKWLRRRSLCAFAADHRACLLAAYADRRAVLAQTTVAATRPLTCGGPWQGRALAATTIAMGQPVAIRDRDGLLGVATRATPPWEPMLKWRAAGGSIRLKAQDGRQFKCRSAPD